MKRQYSYGRGDKYISRQEAAEILGVNEKTISNWLKKRIIKGKETMAGNIMYYKVLKSSLNNEANAICRLCGKRFKAKSPTRNKYCCTEHKTRWHYERKIAKKT